MDYMDKNWRNTGDIEHIIQKRLSTMAGHPAHE